MKQVDKTNTGKNTTDIQTNQEKSESSLKQRRTLLASIGAVGAAGSAGLPTQWKKPVIDHILLPAHAQTSDTTSSTTVASSTTSPGAGSFTTQVTTSFTTAGSAPVSGVFTCSDAFAVTYVLGTFVQTTFPGPQEYVGTAYLVRTCADPQGGTTSSSTLSGTNWSDIITVTTTPPGSYSAFIPTGSHSITGTYTSSVSVTATTIVTSSS